MKITKVKTLVATIPHLDRFGGQGSGPATSRRGIAGAFADGFTGLNGDTIRQDGGLHFTF